MKKKLKYITFKHKSTRVNWNNISRKLTSVSIFVSIIISLIPFEYSIGIKFMQEDL